MAYSTLPTTFADIKSYITTKISQKYSTLGALLENSFLIIFVDLLSYAIEILMSYSSNLFNEQNLDTVTQFENARIKAKFFGYSAHRKISATGNIKVGLSSSFDTSPTENILLEKFDSLSINGVDYLVSADTIFTTADTYKTVPVIQGRYIINSNTAEGTQSEYFEISDDSIENTVLIVEVDGTEWTEVSSFFNSDSDSEHYTVESLSQMSGIKVTFGDDFNGKKLTSGQTVNIKYVQTDDFEGQIKSTGFSVTFLETYTYSDTTPVSLYGENSSQLIGADRIENIDSVKYYGKLAASSIENTAFNDNEIQLEIQYYGGILLSKAVSEYDSSPTSPDVTLANIIKLYIVTTAGSNPDATLKGNLRNYLHSRMDFTDFIQFEDAVFIDIDFVGDYEINTSAPQDFASQVDSFLSTTYALGELNFGESLNHSDVVYAIQNNFSDYIIRFNLTLKVVETESSPFVPTDGFIEKTLKIGGLNSGSDSIKECIIEITYTTASGSASETLTSQTNGTFTVNGGGTSGVFDATSINFETGEIFLDIKETVLDITALEYKYETYDTDGIDLNIDVKTNQVVRYSESNNTVEVVS